VGDRPLSQKKQRLSLCFCWPGTGHAQCVTCVQNEKKKKKKKKKKEKINERGLVLKWGGGLKKTKSFGGSELRPKTEREERKM